MTLRLQQHSQHLLKMPSVSQLSEICIPMVDEVAYKKRKLRVVTIGAGFSGLIFAQMIQHQQPDLQEFIDHTIYEANDDIGGTWKVNTYPGVQCDVPAHIYVSSSDQSC
jgi:cation diffusion facilitator CzcD-associated flavoprotein CzcO